MPTEFTVAKRIEAVVTHGYGFPESRLRGRLDRSQSALRADCEDDVDVQIELAITSLHGLLLQNDQATAEYLEAQLYDLFETRRRLGAILSHESVFLRVSTELSLFQTFINSRHRDADQSRLLDYQLRNILNRYRTEYLPNPQPTLRRSLTYFDRRILRSRDLSDDWLAASAPQSPQIWLEDHLLKMYQDALDPELVNTNIR